MLGLHPKRRIGFRARHALQHVRPTAKLRLWFCPQCVNLARKFLFKFRCFNTVSELYACDWIYAASFAARAAIQGRFVRLRDQFGGNRAY